MVPTAAGLICRRTRPVLSISLISTGGFAKPYIRASRRLPLHLVLAHHYLPHTTVDSDFSPSMAASIEKRAPSLSESDKDKEASIEKQEHPKAGVSVTVYNGDVDTSGVDEKKLLRKMDLALIPWLSFLYLLSFLDRTSIGKCVFLCFKKSAIGMFTDLISSQREGNILYQVQFCSEVEVRRILAVPPRTGPAYDR